MHTGATRDMPAPAPAGAGEGDSGQPPPTGDAAGPGKEREEGVLLLEDMIAKGMVDTGDLVLFNR